MIVSKSPKKSPFLLIIFVTMICAGLFVPSTVYSQMGFIAFNSESGLFRLRLPKDYTFKTNRIKIGTTTAAESGEVIAIVDQRPFKDAVKNYILKYEQTIGTPLTRAESQKIRNIEINTYESFYKSLNGTVRDRKIGNEKGLSLGELYINYEDPSMGPQSIRVHITVTDSMKFQQILTGPDHIMFSLESKNYFDNLKINQGFIKDTTDIREFWTKETSPLQIFDYRLPPMDKVYFTQEPYVESNNESELVAFTFYDPIWKQSVFHRIYGYRFDQTLSFGAAKEIIFKRHSSRFFKKPTPVNFTTGKTAEDIPVVSMSTALTPPKEFPYLDTLTVRALFAGNYMLVHEVSGSRKLVRSNFTDNLMTTVSTFTPEAAQSAHLSNAHLKNTSNLQSIQNDAQSPERPTEEKTSTE